uniref:PBECR2 domain-containing protein n=1 Tax=Rhabditophanes sp. KR3021 TaxID=114890 RepID=A0AC35TQJ0_9BILA
MKAVINSKCDTNGCISDGIEVITAIECAPSTMVESAATAFDVAQQFCPTNRPAFYQASATRRLQQIKKIVESKHATSDSDKSHFFFKTVTVDDSMEITAALTDTCRVYYMIKKSEWIFLERSHDGNHNTMYITKEDVDGQNRIKVLVS